MLTILPLLFNYSKKLRLPIFIQVVYNILCLAVIIGLDPVIIYCKFLADSYVVAWE